MNEFLLFFDQLKRLFPMSLEITHSKITDYIINIYKKGCAADYPNLEHDGDDAILVSVQSDDIELCFAKAHVELKEWLLDNNGGY